MSHHRAWYRSYRIDPTQPAVFNNIDQEVTFKLLVQPLGFLCLLPPILQVVFSPGSSSAHKISTFLTGKNDWRFNPVTSIGMMAVVGIVLLSEIMIKIRIRLATTATTNPNGTGRNSNPIKNMTLIQCITVLLFSFLQMTLINVEAPWLVFPRLLLGSQSTLTFILFFLWSDGARTYVWRNMSGWKIIWAEVRKGLDYWPRCWQVRVHPVE